MQKVEALDDQTTQALLADNRRRTLAVTAATRLAAGVCFLVVGIAWTGSKHMSMGLLALPLSIYVAMASVAFARVPGVVGRRLSTVMPFFDIALSFLVFRNALLADAPYAASWAVVSLAVYTLVVALTGLSMTVWLVAILTGTAILAEVSFLHLAGHHVWPMLISALALGFVAAATSAVSRKTVQAFRHAQETALALDSLAEARNLNRELEQLQREKDSLLELIVHDMRGPVGAALLSVEYMAMELKKQPRRAELLEAADDALSTLGSLSGMISQILDTSKLESGRLTLRLEIAGLRALIEKAVQEAMPRAHGRNIKLDFDAHETVQAAVDLRLMPRALEVLLTHSLRHTTEGGRVLVAATTASGETLISIHANAPAIPAEAREHAFDKFPVADPEARRTSAWGLGLYFCRLVASAHQGTVALEQVDGWAVSYVIRLPSPTRPA